MDKAFCLSNLALRNRELPLPALHRLRGAGATAANPLPPPFLLVKAGQEAQVDVEIGEDQLQAFLDFHGWAVAACACLTTRACGFPLCQRLTVCGGLCAWACGCGCASPRGVYCGRSPVVGTRCSAPDTVTHLIILWSPVPPSVSSPLAAHPPGAQSATKQ